ncbi:hypothetical protein SLEP1_g54817 [Rubroshorea leprosula]|uniref:Retrotransposon Copia-like N-terminal domain-containing protein n=1 Tax=Rubroshorea leprosula TaxID=152421 RepID=A0AAV5MFQ1_9ROSI|nr:hypothetical protein SLEP1_g54817 [Rubroshorea leprosula]
MADETPKSCKIQKQTSSSPYFLNSSDSPGNILVSCPLKGENYPTWLRAMSNALRAKNKFGLVDGSISKLDDDDPDAQAWDKCNSMVTSWLFNSIVPELLDGVANLEKACDVWIDLEERFSQGNAPRVHELKREIAFAQQVSHDPSIESATFTVKNSTIQGDNVNKSQDQPPKWKKGANMNRIQDQSTNWKIGWQNRGSSFKEHYGFSNVANNATMVDNAIMDQSNASPSKLSSSTSPVTRLTLNNMTS